MNKRKLISELKTHHMYISAMDTKKSESVAAGIAINIIKKHEDTGWISVKDELPTFDERVLVAVDLTGRGDLNLILAYLISDEAPYTDDEGNSYSASIAWFDEHEDMIGAEFEDIKYWLPIPRLPKEIEE